MNYKSPIDLMVSQMNVSIENEIYKAVQNVGVNVDKDELMKALAYDRDQYRKGYSDRDSEIIRCKSCKYWHQSLIPGQEKFGDCGQGHGLTVIWEDWFCADGEMKDT